MTTTLFNAEIKKNQLIAFSTRKGRKAIFSVNLLNRPSFYIVGTTLVARMQYGEEIALHDAFSTDSAQQLLDVIVTAIKKNNRHKILAYVMLGGIIATTALVNVLHTKDKSTYGPALPTMAQNTASIEGPRAIAPSTSVQHVLPPQQAIRTSQANSGQPNQANPNQPSPAQIKAGETRLAQNLQKAASRNLFTVPLSNGHERTLFIFADPNCPNCRNFEPLFEALSTRYNVQVFPTTAIGGEESASQIKPVLCLPPEKRKAAWIKLFSEGDNMLHINDPKSDKTQAPALAGKECDLAAKALSVNDVAFKSYHIPGTPWVISDDGRHVPQSVMKSPEEMVKFMSQNSENSQDEEK